MFSMCVSNFLHVFVIVLETEKQSLCQIEAKKMEIFFLDNAALVVTVAVMKLC